MKCIRNTEFYWFDFGSRCWYTSYTPGTVSERIFFKHDYVRKCLSDVCYGTNHGVRQNYRSKVGDKIVPLEDFAHCLSALTIG